MVIRISGGETIMGKRVTITEAVRITGLSVYAIRAGIHQGRYPHIRVGLGAGF